MLNEIHIIIQPFELEIVAITNKTQEGYISSKSVLVFVVFVTVTLTVH